MSTKVPQRLPYSESSVHANKYYCTSPVGISLSLRFLKRESTFYFLSLYKSLQKFSSRVMKGQPKRR